MAHFVDYQAGPLLLFSLVSDKIPHLTLVRLLYELYSQKNNKLLV